MNNEYWTNERKADYLKLLKARKKRAEYIKAYMARKRAAGQIKHWRLYQKEKEAINYDKTKMPRKEVRTTR